VYVGDHVDPVDDEALCCGATKRDMENTTVLGGVDPITGEHRIDPFGESCPTGQTQKEGKGCIRDAVFGVVDKKVGDRGGVTLGAFRIVSEQLSEVVLADLIVVRFESGPFG
jgi:hypothetical protein